MGRILSSVALTACVLAAWTAAAWSAQLIYRPGAAPGGEKRAVVTAEGQPLITVRELDEAMTPVYFEIAREAYARQREWLRWFVESQLFALEAEKRKVSVGALLRSELRADPADKAAWDAARRRYAERLWQEAKITVDWPEPAPPVAPDAGKPVAGLTYLPRTPAQQSETTIVTANGQPMVNLRDFNESLSIAYYGLARRLHAAQLEWLEGTVRDRLIEREAARRKMSSVVLLRAELRADPGDKPRWEAARTAFAKKLREAAQISMTLPEPKRPLVSASEGIRSPVLGLVDAPISVVEFCSYTSAACREGWEALREAFKHYRWRLRIVHRDSFDVADGGRAMIAAIAARCAHRQKKFWYFQDLLYASPDRIGDVAALKGFARSLGLDAPAFDQCLDGRETEEEIGWDLNETRRLGLDTLPALFVNSTYVPGAHRREELIKILDDLAIQ